MILGIRTCCSRLLSIQITAENIFKRSCQTLTASEPTKSETQVATLKQDNSDVHEYLDNLLKEAYMEEKNTSFVEPGGGGPEDEVTPYLAPTFNLAAYVNKSETLQKFIQLGVDLHKIEKRKGLGQFFVKLDFERDCKDHLMFLNDIGVPADTFGKFITKNPLIFKEDIANLQVRVNYLASKEFLPEMISRVVTANPYWLMFDTKRIDRRLGYFQKNFQLSGKEVRLLTCRQPRLITYNLDMVMKNTFCVRDEFGFEKEEMKDLLLTIPKIWMMSKFQLSWCLQRIVSRIKQVERLSCLNRLAAGSKLSFIR